MAFDTGDSVDTADTFETGPASALRPGTGWPPLRVAGHYLLVWRRLWVGSIFSSFASPLLYLVAMGYGLGSLVGRGGRLVDGVSYVAFVTPGVLASTAMQGAIGDSTWPVMSGIKWQRQFHAMLATPLAVRDIVAGHLLYVAARVLVTSTVFLACAAAVGAVHSWWGLLAVPTVVLVGFAFAAPVFAFTTYLERDVGFTVLFRVVMIPLALFSGTFFPLAQLPEVLRAVARATPLWHGVALARDATLGRMDASQDLFHAAYLLVWVVVGTALAVRGLRRRMVV